MTEERDTSPARKILNRRNFLKTTLGATLLTARDSPDPVNTGAPVAFDMPRSVEADLKPQFEKAFAQLDRALEAGMDDVSMLLDRYGISDLRRLQKGISITALPPHGPHKARCMMALDANPKEKYALGGFAQVMDACVELEKLYQQNNRRLPQEKHEHLSYDRVAEKVQALFHKKHPRVPHQLVRVLASDLLDSAMSSSLQFTPPERTPQEVSTDTKRYHAIMEKYKDHALVMSTQVQGLTNAEGLLILDKGQHTKGEPITITPEMRKKALVIVPHPAPEALPPGDVAGLSDAQHSILDAVRRGARQKSLPEHSSSMYMELPGPLGFGEINIKLRIKVLNPTLHANRVQMEEHINAR